MSDTNEFLSSGGLSDVSDGGEDDTRSDEDSEGWGGDKDNLDPNNIATGSARTSRSTPMADFDFQPQQPRKENRMGKSAASAIDVSQENLPRMVARKAPAPRQRNWSISESITAFKSGTRATHHKQCATTESLARASNDAYPNFARELELKGEWSTTFGGYIVEDSIRARTVPTNGHSTLDNVWKRYKLSVKTVVNVIHPLYARICPAGEIPSGKDAAWALAEVTTAYYHAGHGKGVQKSRHQGMDKEPHTFTDAFLSIWRMFGPLGENCPSLRANSVVNGERVPGRNTQRRDAAHLGACFKQTRNKTALRVYVNFCNFT